ncbi:MAG: glutamate--tRNA ligase family protein, partial [Natronospirillum sp.]
AYLLAVVVDDAAQAVSRVVRGHDLFTTTPLQVYLQQRLRSVTPDYLHLPVVNWSDGRKLSKQNHAAPIMVQQKDHLLRQALQVLGLECPTEADPLVWGQAHWTRREANGPAGVTLGFTEPNAAC